jgi:hypothetical protein
MYSRKLGKELTCTSVNRSRTISSPCAPGSLILFPRSYSYCRGPSEVLKIGTRSRRLSLLYVSRAYQTSINSHIDEPVLSSCNEWLCAHPMHVYKILASQRFSDIAEHSWRGLLFLFFLALQRIETHRLVCTKGVDISSRIHETSMRNSRSVVDDLKQSIVFLRLGRVEDIDQTIRARREKKSGMIWVQLQSRDCVGMRLYQRQCGY